MKSWGGLIGLLVVVAIVAAGIYFGVRIGPVFSVCRADSEMSQAEYSEVANLSIDAVRKMRAGEADAVYQMMSTDARAITDRDALVQLARTVGAPELKGEITARHVFRIFALGGSTGNVMCNTPKGTAFLARGGGMRTAFAEVVEPVSGAERSWVVWLQQERGAWRIRALHTEVTAIAGHSGAHLWDMARDEAGRGHAFNATVLYDVAASALRRGPNMQPPEADGFAPAYSALQRHADLPGPPPLTFHLGGREFPIRWMTVTGTGDNKLTLIIDREGPIVSEGEAPARNHELIDAMNAHRGEWKDVFDAIVVGYPTGERGRVWRTVYSGSSGYLEEPAR